MDNRGDHGGAVAIIGVACRFPGAADPAEYHDLTVTGRRMFRLVEGSPGRPLYAAPLDDWVRPVSFGDPEESAQDTGPVQKLAVETAALALADAGLRDVAGMLRNRAGTPRNGAGMPRNGAGMPRNGAGMPRNGAGMPCGGAGMPRADLGGRGPWGGRAGLFIASSVAGVGAFVREQFGFAADVAQPDAAATSSLHAVAAAATALGAGELDLAVAGGVELGLDPAWLAAQARAGTLGRDGMRVYAADPAGLLPGEGCGIVVLARSADVRAAGLPVYAEIAGWNTVPVSPSLGAEALLRAYRQAGVDPADIQLIEGEGTGTAAGDLSELTAFAQLRRGGRATAALGAASASIGYTRAAAGIASLVKTAVAMAAGMIPPGTGCARQHPLIESGDALLRLPRLAEPWPDGNAGAAGTRLAAVNSLGTADPAAWPDRYGLRETEGVHLVLGREAEDDRRRGRRRRPAETAPVTTPVAAPVGAPVTAPALPAVRAEPPTTPLPKIPAAPAARAEPQWGAAESPGVFALCGADPGVVASTLEVIAEGAAALSPADLSGLARELALGVPRGGDHAGPVRVALTAATPGQLAARAQAAARRLTAGTAATAADPDVYVSTGATGRVVVLFGGLAGPGLAQSARLAASLAGLRTLDSLGVAPGTAVGYSLGEITGLVWAGCLPASEGARLAAQCGEVLRGCTCGPAAMARVAADAETARGLGMPDGLHLAAYEGARSHVLAGSTAGIRNLTRRAAAAGVTVEVLGITHALHSPAMASCAAPLRSVFAGTRFAAPRRRLISTITGRQVLPADDLTELLAGQLRRPVLFAQAMELAAGQADLIVIAGPDDSLAGLAAGYGAVPCVTVRGGPAHVGPAAAARAVAALFAAGAVGSGAISDVEPGTGPRGASGTGDTLAGRFVPRMREGATAEASTTIRSV